MKRLQILSALAMTGLLACGGQPATTPSHPEAQRTTEEEAPAPAAEAPAPAAETQAPAEPPMHQGPSVWEGEAVGSWIAALVALQKERGQEIRVRVPLVFASDGWGCRCPSTYIGNDPSSHSGGDTWITVDASALPEPEQQRMRGREGDERVAKDPDAPYQGAVFIVEGYFPGTRTAVDLRNKRKQPKEWLYKTWDLRVVAVLDTAEPAEDLFVHSEQAAAAETQAP